MSEEYLAIYKKYIMERLPSKVMNKFRDVEDELTQYSFSLHNHLIFSYDVCGGCEAHAILTAMHYDEKVASPSDAGITSTSTATATGAATDAKVRAAGLLRDLSRAQREKNMALKYCPSFD
jgi:hypothetical protein